MVTPTFLNESDYSRCNFRWYGHFDYQRWIHKDKECKKQHAQPMPPIIPLRYFICAKNILLLILYAQAGSTPAKQHQVKLCHAAQIRAKWLRFAREFTMFAADPLCMLAFLGAVFCAPHMRIQWNCVLTECSNKQVSFWCTDKIQIIFVCTRLCAGQHRLPSR